MFSLFFSVTQYNIYISPVAPFTLFTFCLMPQSLIKSHACLKSHAHVMWYSNFPWFAECWILRNWSEKWMSWAGTLERYWYMYSISFKAIPLRCLCYLYDGVCCICFDAVFRTLDVAHLLFYSCVVQSHCFTIVSPSFIDVCFVLLCSALSAHLLLLLLLHPVWATCTWGLLCFQLCLSLPLQEWTLRSTFRSVRRRNVRGSIAGTGWRRAEVWIRAKQNVFREGSVWCLFVHLMKL